jgi:PilZ domain
MFYRADADQTDMPAILKMPQLASLDEPSERRMFQRKNAEGRIVGHRIDHTISARRNPRLSLELQDVSVGGIAAWSEGPLEEGEHLTVVFPPRGMRSGWDAFGRVVRCQEGEMGYRVAVEFEQLMAA